LTDVLDLDVVKLNHLASIDVEVHFDGSLSFSTERQTDRQTNTVDGLHYTAATAVGTKQCKRSVYYSLMNIESKLLTVELSSSSAAAAAASMHH